MSPELYWLLVMDRGWARERYEKWLAEVLIAQLLARTATGVSSK
jgi:hypothetical protein